MAVLTEPVSLRVLNECPILPNKVLTTWVAIQISTRCHITDATLLVEAEPGTRIINIHHKCSTLATDAQHKRYRITFGEIDANSTRTILLKLSLRKMVNSSGQLIETLSQILLTTRICYTVESPTDHNTDNKVECLLEGPNSVIQRRLPSGTPKLPPNTEFDYYINRFCLACTIEEMIDLIQAKAYDVATQRMLGMIEILENSPSATLGKTVDLIQTSRSHLPLITSDHHVSSISILTKLYRILVTEDERTDLL